MEEENKMMIKCPYCDFKFGVAEVSLNGQFPDIQPGICEFCAGIYLSVRGRPRMVSSNELKEIKRSPIWKILKKAKKLIEEGQRRI